MTQAETGFGMPSPDDQHTVTAVERVVQAGQRVADALLRTRLAEQDLLEAANDLDAIAKRLGDGALDHEAIVKELLTWRRPPEHDPAAGRRNMMAPPLRLVGDGPNTMVGEVTLGYLYQGPPGHVHGGISAMILDHALGVCNGYSGHAGVTGTLSMRYRRLTPLDVPLTVRAECIDVDGRKIRTVGRIEYQGETCVTAEGLFIQLKGIPPAS